MYNDLGLIAPLRLTDAAQRWYYALEPSWQRYVQRDWGSFRLAVSTYFMNQQWLDKMKGRIYRMRYRQRGHESETPSDYFHRKLRLIQLVFDLTPSEIIMEIMNGAPQYWKVLIDTQRITTIRDLQDYIQFHQENLMRNPETQTHELERRIKALESKSSNRSSRFARTNEAEAETNFVKKRTPFKRKPLVGAHAKFSNYQYPRNDKIVSQGKTPGQKGARPCRHCGSPNHWDSDHKPLNREDRNSRTFLSTLDDESLEAYFAYEECYNNDSEIDDNNTNQLPTIEEEEEPTQFSEQEDFQTPSV